MTAKTSAQKQRDRRAALDQAAQASGWGGWSQFATAVKNGEVAVPAKPKKEIKDETPNSI